MNRFASPLTRAALVAVLAWGGLARATLSMAGAPATIEINNFQFSPAEITIEPGTIVEWVNRDQTIHNIVLTTARVASPGMDTGDHYTYQFNQPGDFPYLCALHPHMTGVVHVKPRA